MAATVNVRDLISGFENAFPSDPQSMKKFGKLNDVNNTALEALKEWKETPSGTFGGIRKMLSKIKIGKVEDKTAATVPHQFKAIDPAKQAELEKKTKLLKTITIVCVVAAIALLAIGLLGPLAAVPFFLALPLSIASGAIIATTVVGLAGVAVAVSTAFVSNPASLRKLREEADSDFHYFVDRFIQNADPKKSIAFNLSDDQIMDKKIHQIYIDWKNGVESILRK